MSASSSTVKVSSPGVLEFPDSESDTPPPNSQTHSASRAPSAPNSPYELVVAIHDQEVIEALAQYDDDGERQAFAAAALKVGVTAMKVASGRLDADLIQRESAHLLRQVGSRLEQRAADSAVGLGSFRPSDRDPVRLEATADFRRRLVFR